MAELVYKSLRTLVAYNSLLAPIHHHKDFLSILPLRLLDKVESVAVSNREVFAQNFDVIDGLFQIIVYMLLYSQYCLLLVSIFEFFGQLIHAKMYILILERNQFKLEIDVIIGLRLLLLAVLLHRLTVIRVTHFDLHLFYGSLRLLLDQDIRFKFSCLDSPFYGLLEQLRLQLVIALLKIRYQPVYNILQSDIFDNSF